MEILIDMVNEYGLNTVILAVIINVLTTIIKTPIKKIARKLEDSSSVTRFIVFIPIAIGFIITYLYNFLIYECVVLNQEFTNLYIRSTCLSLSFYAIFEKLFQSKKKKEESKIEASQEVINMINSVIGEEKIILKGSKKNGIN